MEGGVILREVMGGKHDARVLVVVPAGLKDQWSRELLSSFETDATDADAAWLERSSALFPADVNPWSLPGVYLASTDFVKRAEALHPLEAVSWDLLIVDEAHAITPGSQRRVAIQSLARRSRLVVLLTATPHSGDERQFEELCGTGGGAPAEPIVCFRRLRAEVLPAGHGAKSRVIRVRTSDAEEELHHRLEAYTARLCAEADRADANPVLLATLLRKRALSSAEALKLSLERRLALVDAGKRPLSGVQLTLPLDGEEDVEDRVADLVLGGGGLRDEEEERAAIQRVMETAGEAARDESKLRALLRLLRRAREPAIVFSEYRDTAEHLREVLESAGHRVVALHGGLGAAERRAAVSEFTREHRILVATDAASEGLNLHDRCRLVVHFELPWSPMRLHQRCGRVNRIGQARQVHEVALVADNTAEQLVIRPLMERFGRAGRFGAGTIVAQLPESTVAAQVLGVGGPAPDAGMRARLPDGLIQLDLREEASAEAERLSLLRRLAGRGEASRAGPPVLAAGTVARRSRSKCELTLLVETTIRDGTREILEQEIVAIAGSVPGLVWHRTRRGLRRQIAAIVERHADISRGLRRRTREKLFGVRTLHAKVRRAALEREAAIVAAGGSAARQLVQAGLFERPPRTVRSRRPEACPGEHHENEPETSRGFLTATVRIRAVWCGGLP